MRARTRRTIAAAALIGCAGPGCEALIGADFDNDRRREVDAAVAADGPADAGSGGDRDGGATCHGDVPFGKPQIVAITNDTGAKLAARLTPDEKVVYFASAGQTSASAVVYVAVRDDPRGVFGSPVAVANLKSGATIDGWPTVTADAGKLVFMSRSAAASANATDLFVATGQELPDGGRGFSAPAPLSILNGSSFDGQPFLTADGTELWFASDRSGTTGRTIHMSRDRGSGFEPPTRVVLNGAAAAETAPVVSFDKRTVFFASAAMGASDHDVWVVVRDVRGDVSVAPRRVDELSAEGDDLPSWLSPDECRLYLTRIGPDGGAATMLVAERSPAAP